MPVLNRIADFAEDMTAWRHHLHQNPELGFECYETAAFVAAGLREMGVDEVHEGIAVSGVVGVIYGSAPGRTIALRADMDALAIHEETDAPYKSRIAGKMHACGHDGHTTMLLGAARYLCETRRFAGRVVLLFQPAEEEGGGGEAMVQEGVMTRFNVDEVYGIHNMPGAPLGHFYTRAGALMASVDTGIVHVTGKGGHGAMPHECIDPIPALAAMVQSLQTIVSRNISALDEAVVSVTIIQAGSANNIIPENAMFCATIRCFKPEVREMLKQRFHEIIEGQARAYNVSVKIDYEWGYPATVNHGPQAEFAAQIAAEIVGDAQVDGDTQRMMGSEDFSYMLNARPGAYLFMGIGQRGGGLHHPAYDFNDEAAPVGASFFARLVERALPL